MEFKRHPFKKRGFHATPRFLNGYIKACLKYNGFIFCQERCLRLLPGLSCFNSVNIWGFCQTNKQLKKN